MADACKTILLLCFGGADINSLAVVCRQFLCVETSVAVRSWFYWTTASMTIWMTETASAYVNCTRLLYFMTTSSWSDILCSLAFKVRTADCVLL